MLSVSLSNIARCLTASNRGPMLNLTASASVRVVRTYRMGYTERVSHQKSPLIFSFKVILNTTHIFTAIWKKCPDKFLVVYNFGQVWELPGRFPKSPQRRRCFKKWFLNSDFLARGIFSGFIILFRIDFQGIDYIKLNAINFFLLIFICFVFEEISLWKLNLMKHFLVILFWSS